MLEEDGDPNAGGKRFDAVGRFEEPEEPGPGDIGPTIPEAPDTTAAAADADPAVQRLFWGLVVLFNVAIVAVSIGAMMIGFGTHPTLGRPVLVAGLVLLVYGAYRYRHARSEVASLVGDAGGGDQPTDPEDNG